jgi:hypothetical protein
MTDWPQDCWTCVSYVFAGQKLVCTHWDKEFPNRFNWATDPEHTKPGERKCKYWKCRYEDEEEQ